ncbi:hypothetical protein PG991_000157 [Apiospora marii]|uniref:DUF6546 domain-containing protein n=1 Tax=Apiospora marii TaxID=335849 RepID=A0ABR1T386_9PEZI
MDRIPPEIKSQILRLAFTDEDGHSTSKLMSKYATVSREWQEHVESITFKGIYLNPRRLDEAKKIMTTSRQNYVRVVHLGASLWDRPNLGSSERDNAISIEFSQQLASLLDYLHGWNVTHAKVELVLILNFKYHGIRSLISLRADVYRRLPNIHFITKFTIPTVRELKLNPMTCCEIASLFPNVRSIDWYLQLSLETFDSQAQFRQNFAAALALIPASVRDFTLSYRCVILPSDLNAAGSLRPSSGAPDSLSVALRRLSNQLETVHLDMVIDSEVFFGADMHPEEAHWPRMRAVTVVLGGKTSEGDNIFVPGATPALPIPVQKVVNQYYLAAGTAAAGMRNLKRLEISQRFPPTMMFEYLVNDATTGADLYITDVKELKLPPNVEEVWWRAAREHLRTGATLQVNLEDIGQGITRQYTLSSNGQSSAPVRSLEQTITV